MSFVSSYGLLLHRVYTMTHVSSLERNERKCFVNFTGKNATYAREEKFLIINRRIEFVKFHFFVENEK